MALEVIAVAIFQPRLSILFHQGSLKVTLQELIVATMQRLPKEGALPILPHLPQAVQRLYTAIQKSGGKPFVNQVALPIHTPPFSTPIHTPHNSVSYSHILFPLPGRLFYAHLLPTPFNPHHHVCVFLMHILPGVGAALS